MKYGTKRVLLHLPGFEWLCRLLTRQHVRAFMYHRFDRGLDKSSPNPGKSDLEMQLQLVKANHSVLTPSGHLQFIKGSVQGHCPVVFTVDDGYADFGEVAYPVFKEMNLPVMLFVTSGFVAGDIWFWWDKLKFILNINCSDSLPFVHEDRTFVLNLSTASGREQSWHRVADHCRFIPDLEKHRLISNLANHLDVQLPASPPPEEKALSWDQIREMEKHGVVFGAHTVNHPILTQVPLEISQKELAGSKERLENELGHPVTWFCYPQGGPADFNREIMEQASELFDGAYVAYQRVDDEINLFSLPRYGVSRNLVNFRWVLCGAEYLVLRIKKALGLRTGVGSSYWDGSPSGETN